MKASASNKHSPQSTPKAWVFTALSPANAELWVLKALSQEKLEIIRPEINRLVKRLVWASKGLHETQFDLVKAQVITANKANHSNRTFIQSLAQESGKLLSKNNE